jgi:hypothetical protein
MRRKAGMPSTSGRTRLPGRAGYEPQATNGICGAGSPPPAGSLWVNWVYLAARLGGL